MRNLDIRQGVLITAVAAALGLLALAPTAIAGTRSKSVTVQGDGVIGDVTAKCKGGQRATGGGFLTSPSVSTRGVVVFKSQKSGQRAWRVSAQLIDPGAPQAATITAYAYCSRKASKTATASLTTTGTGTNFGVSTSCPAGHARAGGFSLSPPVYTNVPTPTVNRVVSDSFRSDKKTWRTVFTVTSATSATMTSFAYCAKGAGGSRVGSATGTSSTTALAPNCSKGVGSGGFSQSPFGRQIIYQSMKSGKGWRASGVQLGPPPPLVTSTLVSRAYCL